MLIITNENIRWFIIGFNVLFYILEIVHRYSILTTTFEFSLLLHKTTLDDRIISDDRNNLAHFTMC